MDSCRYLLTQNAYWQSLMAIMCVPIMINCFNFASALTAPTVKNVMFGQNTMNNK